MMSIRGLCIYSLLLNKNLSTFFYSFHKKAIAIKPNCVWYFWKAVINDNWASNLKNDFLHLFNRYKKENFQVRNQFFQICFLHHSISKICIFVFFNTKNY